MQRGESAVGKVAHQGSVNYVNMKVKHVELVHAAADLVQHDHVVGQGIAHCRIETQGHVAAAHELSRCLRVTAREKCDVVSLTHQLFSQERYDPFGATIESRRYALMKRGNLSNTHRHARETIHKSPNTGWRDVLDLAQFRVSPARQASG